MSGIGIFCLSVFWIVYVLVELFVMWLFMLLRLLFFLWNVFL